MPGFAIPSWDFPNRVEVRQITGGVSILDCGEFSDDYRKDKAMTKQQIETREGGK